MGTTHSTKSIRLARDVHSRARRLLDDLRDLLDELEISYERQALLQQVDDAILRAGPNPAAVLDFIIRQALSKTSSDHGSVVEYRDDRLVVVASTDGALLGRELAIYGSLCGRAVSENADQRVSDVGALPEAEYTRTHANTKAELARLIRPGHGHRMLGVLDLQRSDRGDYTDAEVAFADALTGQLAIAIQHAREREAFESIYDTLTSAMHEGFNEDTIYSAFVQAVLRAVNASYGQLMRWTGSDFMIVASSQASDIGLRLSGSAVGHYIVTNEGTDLLAIDDIARSRYARHYVAMLRSPKGPMRSEVIVPLWVGPELVGALNLESRRVHAFTEFETHLLNALQQPLARALHAASSQLRRLQRERTEASQLTLGSVRAATAGLLHQAGGLVSESRGRMLEILELAQSSDPTRTAVLAQQIAPAAIDSLNEANQTIARLMTGLRPDQKEPEAIVVELRALCDAAIKRTRRRHHGLEITLENRLPSPPRGSDVRKVISGARCELDHQASELFLNLLDNAARAVLQKWGTDGGGEIVVTLELQDTSHVRVRIADNGIGVAPDIRDRIFDYGFSGRPDGSQSFGVGLWWCNLYVRSYGGSISVDPSRDDGATFYVVLPLSLSTWPEEQPTEMLAGQPKSQRA